MTGVFNKENQMNKAKGRLDPELLGCSIGCIIPQFFKKND
jgi:hypothetical protein